MSGRENLIDLSADELESESGNAQIISSAAPAPAAILCPTLLEYENPNNNPFDYMQNLTQRSDDPFEIVEKEACFKSRYTSLMPPGDVKEADLLALSDDDIRNATSKNFNFSYCQADTANNSNLENESPPFPIMTDNERERCGSDSGGHSGSSTDGSGGCARKTMEYRKRLLKLSIANSTFNSPISHCNAGEQLLVFDSPISAAFAHAAESDEQMLSAESPLKLVDDEPEPRKSLDGETKFKADLAMLTIPILQELPSPPVVDVAPVFPGQYTNKTNADENNEDEAWKTRKSTAAAVAALSDLATIRAKLLAKREASNHRDVSQLINNLKQLILKENVVDTGKKKQAEGLLETLSEALTDQLKESGLSMSADEEKKTESEGNPNESIPRSPIVRQGTFSKDSQDEDDQQVATPVPDIMLKSSGTYDGEAGDEKRDMLIRPEIEPLSPLATISPIPTPLVSAEVTPDPTINDFIGQLGKLVEQHNCAQQRALQNDCSDGGRSNAGDEASNDSSNSANQVPTPATFIVVMNAHDAQKTTGSFAGTLASYLENTLVAPLLDSSISSAAPAPRRRSQSLSLHDRVIVLQWPQSATELEPANEMSMLATINDDAASRFETPVPARRLPRRNSFSTDSSTPLPSLKLRAAATGCARRSIIDTAAPPKSSYTRRNILDTHNDRQQNMLSRGGQIANAVGGATPLPALHTFKPNLKKLRTVSTTDSVLRSSAPLKATIPVKRMASAPKTAAPTLIVSRVKSSNNTATSAATLNSSMHLLGQPSRISLTSTPLLTVGGTLPRPQPTVTAHAYPTACSTPAARKSPLMRTCAVGTITMPAKMTRHSRLSTTPYAKPPPSSRATATISRRTLAEMSSSRSPAKALGNGVPSGLKVPTSLSSTRRQSISHLPPPSTSRLLNASLTSTRSANASCAATNKENKHP